MKTPPRISDAEWEIMKVLWAKAPCSAGEVVDAVTGANRAWHPKTVKTFLSRLVGKGVIEFRAHGRAYLYQPLVSERECIDAASESFLERVFGGSLKPMLAHFVLHKKLSPREIRELKNLLDKKET